MDTRHKFGKDKVRWISSSNARAWRGRREIQTVLQIISISVLWNPLTYWRRHKEARYQLQEIHYSKGTTGHYFEVIKKELHCLKFIQIIRASFLLIVAVVGERGTPWVLKCACANWAMLWKNRRVGDWSSYACDVAGVARVASQRVWTHLLKIHTGDCKPRSLASRASRA